MKRIYVCIGIVVLLLAAAFYSSFRVQQFAEDISDDIDTAMEDIRNSDLTGARQALAEGAELCDTMREGMNHLLRTQDFTELETALRESEDTACRLRQELQTERRKCRELQEELDTTKDAHDAAIGAMWSARNEVDNLKQENGKLTEALNTERETAEHWREEHQKEQLWRMSTEGHILRELHNILNYDGSAHGQEELEE